MVNILENHITALAAGSALAKFKWNDRGRAPIGYVKGMALTYGRVYAKFKNKDAAALDMAKKDSGNPATDALSWYATVFKKAGMDNSANGVNTLRHLWVLLIGLGMRESSGNCFEGRDVSAKNFSADMCEAGAFQTSWNLHSASSLLPKIFASYRTGDDFPLDGYLDVFKEGLRVKNTENYGQGDGEEFQRLCKKNPSFAAEFAAVGMRHLKGHWGPIARRQAQVRPEADQLLHQIEGIVDVVPPDAAHIA